MMSQSALACGPVCRDHVQGISEIGERVEGDLEPLSRTDNAPRTDKVFQGNWVEWVLSKC